MTFLVGYLLLFGVVGVAFILLHLVAGKFIRPSKPGAEKLTIYECGEPTIGSAWVQFDLRYYVVALLFVIFDVEVAFFFPWAVVFGQANTLARVQEFNNPAAVTEQSKLAKRELLNLPPTPDANPLTADQQHARGVWKINSAEDAFGEEEQAKANQVGHDLSWFALADVLLFFGILLVGFAYLWKRGDLAWVRSTTAETAAPIAPPPPREPAGVLVGAGRE